MTDSLTTTEPSRTLVQFEIQTSQNITRTALFRLSGAFDLRDFREQQSRKYAALQTLVALAIDSREEERVGERNAREPMIRHNS